MPFLLQLLWRFYCCSTVAGAGAGAGAGLGLGLGLGGAGALGLGLGRWSYDGGDHGGDEHCCITSLYFVNLSICCSYHYVSIL